MDRSSFLIKVARVAQRLAPLMRPIDVLFKTKTTENSPVIFIIAPPRSGSTLSYQFIRTAFKTQYLSNLHNLLYALPNLAFKLGQEYNSTPSSYNSKHGLVPGVRGEAEGLKFWQYWIGQGLEEAPQDLDLTKGREIAQTIQSKTKKDEVFVSGYLGHIFCIDTLRELFPEAIFAFVKRNPLNNAKSIYKASPEKWFSLKPKGWLDFTSKSRENQIAFQLHSLHQIMESKFNEKDSVWLSYEETCSNPQSTIDKLQQHASSRSLALHRSSHKIPNDFNRPQSKANEVLENKLNKALSEYFS